VSPEKLYAMPAEWEEERGVVGAERRTAAYRVGSRRTGGQTHHARCEMSRTHAACVVPPADALVRGLDPEPRHCQGDPLAYL
jgi:hypothetical protein